MNDIIETLLKEPQLDIPKNWRFKFNIAPKQLHAIKFKGRGKAFNNLIFSFFCPRKPKYRLILKDKRSRKILKRKEQEEKVLNLKNSRWGGGDR